MENVNDFIIIRRLFISNQFARRLSVNKNKTRCENNKYEIKPSKGSDKK